MSCPECKGNNVEQETVGYLEGKDLNRAICSDCGWEGRAFELEESDDE